MSCLLLKTKVDLQLSTKYETARFNHFCDDQMVRMSEAFFEKLILFYGDIITASVICTLNTLKPRQNGRHFAVDPFKRIYLNETLRISIKISLKFVPKVPVNNIPALVQIMVWRRAGEKPFF